MTQTLSGADIRGYYGALGIHIPRWAQHEACVRCFVNPDAHRRGDQDPSCSINTISGLWNCHGCGAGGHPYEAAIALGHTVRAARYLMVAYGLAEPHGPWVAPQSASAQHVQTRPQPRIARMHGRPALRVSEADIRHWQAALTEQAELIGRLTRDRRWLYSTMLELGLGYDCGRITIPVRDEARRLVGLLRYRPWRKPGQVKMIAALGSRRALLPHPAAEPSNRVLLVEGEPDMIAARSQGLPAIAVPGASAWRAEWAQLFHGREVTIVMDCDAEGRRAADRIANDLRAEADALVVELAERDDGYDLTDWLSDNKQGGPAQ